ncbi:MAP7 domain-containing protein 1-like isoform X2 [Conger conger]|uniref:MAP7 domain-containing protein 1-like isoform X2 n=1 Tax=Conger conger TaxID=82655 RepID=UPI002A5A3ADB|nr:MAP7 domain-containing protein 1-like isoform X2 [Conger conger]
MKKMECKDLDTGLRENGLPAGKSFPSTPEARPSEEKDAYSILKTDSSPNQDSSSTTDSSPTTGSTIKADYSLKPELSSKPDSTSKPDASTKPDSSCKQASSVKTDSSSKPDSTLKTDGSLPPTSRKAGLQNKKADGPKLEERLKLAKERREERARYLEQRTKQQAAKRAQWLEKEARARQQRERQLEDRRRKLEEQRLRAEKRRALLQEKERQKLEKNKERYDAAVRRSSKKTWAEIRQLRWSWAGGLNQTSSRESRCSTSTVASPKRVDSVFAKRLSKSSASLWSTPSGTRSLQLSARESKIVERLMTPTLSFLARSRSTILLSSAKDSHSCLRSQSANPLSACTHTCSGHRKVSASTPDITQRQRRLDSTPEEKKKKKKKKEKKDKERENEREKAMGKEKDQKPRRPLKQRVETSAPRTRNQLTPPTKTSQNKPTSPSPAASSVGPKTRPKRSKTPARVQLQATSPVAVETVGESDKPVGPEDTKSSTSVPPNVVSSAPTTAPSQSPSTPPPSTPSTSEPSPSSPSLCTPSTSAPSTSVASPTTPAPSPSTPTPAPSPSTPAPSPSTPAPSPSTPAPSPSTPSSSGPAPASSHTGGKPTAGTTDQEQAARSLAEKRRQIREEREREEQERREQEERDRVLREERLAWEQEERRCREEEAQRVAEEQQAVAQQLEEAAQKESDRLQKMKEEEAARAREEAERLRQERNKHFQKEEEERMERKKRLEEIMKRTRKTEGGDKNDSSQQKGSPAPQVDGKDVQRDTESSETPPDDNQHNPHTTQSNKVEETVQPQGGMKVSPVINGVQATGQHNGLSDLQIIQLANHRGGSDEGRDRSEPAIPSGPIQALESGEPFLMTTGSLKAQHVAGVL